MAFIKQRIGFIKKFIQAKRCAHVINNFYVHNKESVLEECTCEKTVVVNEVSSLKTGALDVSIKCV